MAEWSIPALKEYVDGRFEAIREAIGTATEALNYRLHDMNQWREQLDRERRDLVTISKHDELARRIEEVRDAYVSNERYEAGIDKLDGRLDRIESWQAKLIGAIGLVAFLTPLVTGLIVWYITHHHAP